MPAKDPVPKFDLMICQPDGGHGEICFTNGLSLAVRCDEGYVKSHSNLRRWASGQTDDKGPEKHTTAEIQFKCH